MKRLISTACAEHSISTMLSSMPLRIPKTIVRVIVPLVLLLLIIFMTTYHHVVDPTLFDKSYAHLVSLLRSTTNTTTSLGHILEPQSVSFKYIHTKEGSPKEILASNQEIYDLVLAQEIHEPKDFDMDSIRPPSNILSYQHENATIIALVRNNEISGIRRTMKHFEKNFNSKFHYPYTFLNDKPFTERFKERVRSFTDAPVEFVHIPPEMWNKPSTIDGVKEALAMEELSRNNVQYSKKLSYHNMCRFYSGNFHHLPELQKYKYYWRIEPNVMFYSDLNYDVFKYLSGTKKIYGFTINLYDIDVTIPTLFPETLSFLNTGDNYKYVNPNGAFQWITENQQNPQKAKTANGYSTCHFWSNFEIADMDFYRGEAYTNWFNHLDATGKFYYERWGDAPVHSLGLALFADKNDIHWFRDIGYYHSPYTNCPNSVNTKGCKLGKFDDSGHNMDQNCMATWIQYEIEDLSKIY